MSLDERAERSIEEARRIKKTAEELRLASSILQHNYLRTLRLTQRVPTESSNRIAQ
jgi:hypothetical protein